MYGPRVKTCDAIIKLSMLFPITTLIERYIGFANKLLLVILFILLLLQMFNERIYKWTFLFLLFASTAFSISILLTELDVMLLNPNMAIYYIFLYLYYFYIIQNKDIVVRVLERAKQYMCAVVWLYTIILCISIFIPWSYMYMEGSGWGDELYFASFSKSPNRVGPASLFILVLLIYLLRFGKKRLLRHFLLIPHLYVGINGGSRTYFALILCAIVIYLYYWLNPKGLFWPLLVPMSIAVICFVYTSPMMTKIEISIKYLHTGNSAIFWQRFSDHRSILWAERIQAFLDFPIFNKIFGKGVNFALSELGLWSHNDFIEILCSYGYIGIIDYLVTMIAAVRQLIDKNSKLIPRILSCFIWIFNAVFNFFYCYFNSALCFPILLLALRENRGYHQ